MSAAPAGARRAAVLGRPIGHSLSPVLHRAAYAALGLTGWTYDALDCGAEELPGVVRSSGPEWAGYSVTMPGKRAALECADRVTALAVQVGAANTLIRGPDGSWTADNTDVHGILAALGPLAGAGVVSGLDAVVLGAGGTAQAAVAALAAMGTTAATVVVRDPSRTVEVVAAADRAGVSVRVVEFGAAIDAVLARAGLVVSTLPAGAGDLLADRSWPSGPTLLDARYHPWPTALAISVARSGGRVVGGAEMLLHQAAAQVRLMTGRPAPITAMSAALRAALSADQADRRR